MDRTFPIHPLRGRVLSELHARPFAAVETPSRVIRLGFTTQPERLALAQSALAQRCERSGLRSPPPDARHVKLDFPEGCFQFERHNEFVTYTWILPGSKIPFDPAPGAFQVLDWLPAPGLLIVAIDTHVIAASSVADVPALFPGSGYASSHVNDGRALVATDFRADSRGFVRMLVLDKSLEPTSSAHLVQSLLEIETYRSLALLGLPEALSRGGEVDAVERLLPTLMTDVQNTSGVAGNRELLERLTAVSAEVETSAALSSFRFGATRAYAQLIEERLALLGEVELPSTITLQSFLARRFSPAVRTCDAVDGRLSSLSLRIGRATSLLRTRVDVDLETQNSQLLHQMSDRLRLQIRLQQTVEALSVAAITYYAAGITRYVVEPLEQAGWPIRTSYATALIVPLVIVASVLMLLRARRPEDPSLSNM